MKEQLAAISTKANSKEKNFEYLDKSITKICTFAWHVMSIDLLLSTYNFFWKWLVRAKIALFSMLNGATLFYSATPLRMRDF